MANDIRESMESKDFKIICRDSQREDETVDAHLFVLKTECGHVQEILEFDKSCRTITLPFKKELVDEALGHIYGYFFVRKYANKGVLRRELDIALPWHLYCVFRALDAQFFMEWKHYHELCGLPKIVEKPANDLSGTKYQMYVDFIRDPLAKCPDVDLALLLLKQSYIFIIMKYMQKVDFVDLDFKLDGVTFDHEIMIESLEELVEYVNFDKNVAIGRKCGSRYNRLSLDGVYRFIVLYCFSNPEVIPSIKERFLSRFPNSGYRLCPMVTLSHAIGTRDRGFHSAYEEMFGITPEDAFIFDVKNKSFACTHLEVKVIPQKDPSTDIHFRLIMISGEKHDITSVKLPKEVYDELNISNFET